MVARTPTKEKKMAVSLNPNLLRETLKKVDMCMDRLQELQYTVSGGTKAIKGVNLSPRSTRGYIKTSLRCKQESLRIKNDVARKSPAAKFQASTVGEWRRMSLPAMLVGETVSEILQASQFAKEVVIAVTKATRTVSNDPKTPVTNQTNKKPSNIELRSRRIREKQGVLQSIRVDSNSPALRKARSRINFKVSPSNKRELLGKENRQHIAAHRISPKNRPWAKKTVLFPNPLFISSPSSHQQKFCKTRSPIIASKQHTPHKFLIKSPPTLSKFQGKIKNHAITLSPTRPIASIAKKSPKLTTASKLRRSFSPSKLANTLVSRRSFSPSKLANTLVSRRSFSPSKLANTLVSPLKNRISFRKSEGVIRGLKQRPPSTPMRFGPRKN